MTITWTPIGDAGNAADTADGDFRTPGIQRFGAVPYAYNIGTYDVTVSQYVEFLNAKDATGANALGLYSDAMSQSFTRGISFNAGNANGSKYTVLAGRGNYAMNYVSWYSAIRFANWLNNGQGNGDTETGAYTLLGGSPVPSNGSSITRNAGATVFLPSEDEWYKAAYYDPRTTLQGGPPSDSHYWLYPTGSMTAPTASSPTAVPNSVNTDSVVGDVTPVGAYTRTTSPYGAFDMGGNVFQWNEALISAPGRGRRGGAYTASTVSSTMSSFRDFTNANAGGDPTSGFRVASVPEPTTMLLAVLGGLGLLSLVVRKHIAPRHRESTAQVLRK